MCDSSLSIWQAAGEAHAMPNTAGRRLDAVGNSGSQVVQCKPNRPPEGRKSVTFRPGCEKSQPARNAIALSIVSCGLASKAAATLRKQPFWPAAAEAAGEADGAPCAEPWDAASSEAAAAAAEEAGLLPPLLPPPPAMSLPPPLPLPPPNVLAAPVVPLSIATLKGMTCWMMRVGNSTASMTCTTARKRERAKKVGSHLQSKCAKPAAHCPTGCCQVQACLCGTAPRWSSAGPLSCTRRTGAAAREQQDRGKTTRFAAKLEHYESA